MLGGVSGVLCKSLFHEVAILHATVHITYDHTPHSKQFKGSFGK